VESNWAKCWAAAPSDRLQTAERLAIATLARLSDGVAFPGPVGEGLVRVEPSAPGAPVMLIMGPTLEGGLVLETTDTTMHPTHLASRGLRFFALTLLVALATMTAGCQQSCDVLCSENARYIDGCLEYWEALWPDFGFDGRRDSEQADGAGQPGDQYEGGPAGEYQERCRERYRTAMQYSEVEAARLVRTGCSTDLQALSSSVGCQDYTPSDFELDPVDGDNGVAPRP